MPICRSKIMIDDAPPAPLQKRTAAELLAEVRRCEHEAELFLAYDLARKGLEEFPGDLALKHRAVLCLASTGASARAAEEFRRLGLDRLAQSASPDIPAPLAFEIASLAARLLKDEAIATTGPERARKLIEAVAAYEAVYRSMQAAGSRESYYPGINCATLHLLAGDDAAAEVLARELLDRLAAWPAEDKTYYEIATELEARLIIGDFAGAGSAARIIAAQARENSQHDFRALASTIRQLRLVAAAKQIDIETLAALAPPRVIHYLGHIISAPGGRGRFPASEEEAARRQIVHRIAAADISFAYGSLAAGADILFAEAVLERGASLHVVLPFAVEEFIEVSVRPAGPGWVERFRRCFDAAATRHFATTERYLGDDSLFGYCSQLAMGLALLRAGHICAPAEQIALWDGNPAAGPVGTAVDVAVWKSAGMPQTIIPVAGGARPVPAAPSAALASGRTERRTRAMLFGDVKGFSKLTDEELPRFVETVLGAFGRVIDEFAADTLLVNTWGDGLFLVFDDAGKAAACALALQEAMDGIDLAAAGLPDTMALRLGGHLGPVYAADDPILHSPNFFGAHVSRAARIEPVTPEKLVYVTETLAAVLALHNADAFDCSYVGMTKAAKDYGEMRMFLLSRRPS
jgi:class 3 adenylate cyclase